MPLSAELEKVVGLIQDPTQREAARKRLTELEEGGLRQSEFSKRMNELDARDRQREATHQANLQWNEQNREFYKRAITERDDALKRADAALAKARELESAHPGNGNGGAGDIDPADEAAMAKALREAREQAVASRTMANELENRLKRIDDMIQNGQILTKEKFEEEANRRLNAYGTAILSVGDFERRHEREYGKPIDRGVLLKASDELGGDLEKAYKFVTEDLRLEKMRADIRAEVEKELKDKMRADGVPIASGTGPIMGPLQQRIFKQNNSGESTIDPNIKADGSGRLGAAIAAEMRAEGIT